MFMKQMMMIVFAVSWAAASLATVRKSVLSGNWSHPSTWGGSLPQPDDEVVISGATTVNFNQASANWIAGLTVEAGARLLITVNGASLHIGGTIRNDGELTTWVSNTLKGTIFLHGDSYWSGGGRWNTGMLQLGAYALDFDDDMTIYIADNVVGDPGAAINKRQRRTHTVLVFNGTQNATIPSESASFYYPSLVVAKTSQDGLPVTLSFKDSTLPNSVPILGALTLVETTDRLAAGNQNTLKLTWGTTGKGTLSGGVSSGVYLETTMGQTERLSFTPGTSFRTVSIAGEGTVSLENGFTIRDELTVAAGTTLLLPDGATLTLGVNGTAPSLGLLSCLGRLVPGHQSGLAFRGASPLPMEVRLTASNGDTPVLGSLEISRMPQAGEISLPPGAALEVSGLFQVDPGNGLYLGGGTLYLDYTVTISSGGWITGSTRSSLILQGSGGNATLRFNPTGGRDNRTLGTFELNRSPGRSITLADSLFISSLVNVKSGKLLSNGKLELLSSEQGSAEIARLSPEADVVGDVTVQSWIRGGPGMRGTRMLCPPIDDSRTALTVFQQLKQSVLVTGNKGTQNGFDAGGILQPFAPSIQTYRESAGKEESQFLPLPDIYQRGVSFPGTGKAIFLFFRGDRTQPEKKLRPAGTVFPDPESVTLRYTGPINKGTLVVPLSYTVQPGDPYIGYNAVGNPYPATVNWANIGKSNVADVVSIIRPGGGFVTYSSGVIVNAPPGSDGQPAQSVLPLVQPGQGFYVRASATNASLTFTEDAKATLSRPDRYLFSAARPVISAKGGNKPESDRTVDRPATKVSSARALPTVRIALSTCGRTTGNTGEETAIVFHEGASASWDDYDAPYIMGAPVSIACVQDVDNILAIDFRPPDDHPLPVILRVKADSSGCYRLSIRMNEAGKTMLNGVRTLLRDKLLGRVVAVGLEGDYPFRIEKENPATFGDDRFELLFSRDDALTSETYAGSNVMKLIYPVPVTNVLYVNMPAAPDFTSLVIFDLQGRCMGRSWQWATPVSEWLPAGQYIAEVRGKGGRVIGRVRVFKKE